MKIRSIVLAFGLCLASAAALAQSTVLQGGPWKPGHAPQYVGQGSSVPVIQDAGGAAGGAIGTTLSELGITSRSPTNTYPSVNSGAGPSNTHACMYDAPTTNATGYHYLCLDPNAQGGGLLTYGAGGGASILPFYFNINGTPTAPGGVSNTIGVGSTAVAGATSGQVLYNNSGALGATSTLSNIGLSSPAITGNPTGLPALEFTGYGADPTGVAYSDTAFTNWLAAMKATGQPGHARYGNYSFSNQNLFDVANVLGQGVRIYGDGCNATYFTYKGSSAPAFRLGTDTANKVGPIGNLVAGSGYVNGTYTNVPFTGGTGTGATANLTVSGGAVVLTSITIANGGSGYLVGDTLSVSNSSLGGSGSGFSVTVRGDSFYSQIKGINFVGNVPGPLFQLGRNDMLDALNAPVIDVCENNNSTNAAAEQVRINAVLDSPYLNNVASGPGATNGHSACEFRGAAFDNIYGSCSGMTIGQHWTATTAQAEFGNINHAVDLEVDGKSVVIDATGGGSAPQKNTWIGGQVSYVTCAIDAQAGNYNVFENENLGGVNDFCGTTGISFIGPGYLAYLNVVMQALGITSASNSIVALPNASVASGFNAFAGGNSFISEVLANGNSYISNATASAVTQFYQVTATAAHSFIVGAASLGTIDANGWENLYSVGVGTTANGAGNVNISGTYQVSGSQIGVGNLANVAAKSIVGNSSVSSAVPSALTVPATQAMLGDATIMYLSTANFNLANTDVASFAITLPTGFTRYLVARMQITGASGTLTTATAGLFTAAGGGGVAVASTQSITVSTASDATNNNTMPLTINNPGTQSYTVSGNPTLYLRVSTPEGVAATASVALQIVAVP